MAWQGVVRLVAARQVIAGSGEAGFGAALFGINQGRNAMQIETVDPRRLDQLPVRAVEGGEEPERVGPVELIDILTAELSRRVLLVSAAVRQLPDGGEAVAGALAELRKAGAELAAAGADEATRPSGMVERCRRLHRRLSQLEELVWLGVCRAVKVAEERGDVQ
jgi:hypothetical protein